MTKLTKNQRIFALEVQVKALLDKAKLNETQLKQLDQSVFDGLDEKWRFAAVDADGDAWRYREKPMIDNGDDSWSPSNTVPLLIGNGYDTSNWKTSLIERDTAEPTGSELCKAMLARGDKYVLCLVKDTNEKLAENYGVRVICSYGADYFDDTSEDMWYFAIPVNNQGEPLTAKDVGL